MKTKTATHTPGPWEISCDGYGIIADNQKQITRIKYTNPVTSPSVGHITLQEAKANARLIAAAPELLSALKDLVAIQDVKEHDSGEEQLSNPHDSESCVLCTAREVIAKAEGRD